MVRYRYPQRKLCLSLRCLQDVFKTCLQDVFSVTIFRLPRRLEDALKTFSRYFARCLQDVFARRLQDVLEDEKLLRWRRVEVVFKTCLQEVLKTNKCLLSNALAKISKKGHNTLWNSKQCSNLLSTSHNLGSKYAYIVYKSKNKSWFRETSWKSDTGICFYHPH